MAIDRILTPDNTSQVVITYATTADERATLLSGLQSQQQLTLPQVREVLSTCNDNRRVLNTVQKTLWKSSPGHMAWSLLDQQFEMPIDALQLLIGSLHNNDALVCVALARWLKTNGKRLSHNLRQEAKQQILTILRDDMLSRRPLNMPVYSGERLDDILFDTLKVLAE